MASSDGFKEFYDAEFPGLRRLAYRLTGSWADADDLAQETMVRVYSSWSRVLRADRPGAYARTVMVNAQRSSVRRVLRLRYVPQDPPQPPDHEPSELWDEIIRLPLRQRQAIVLHFYEDISQVEVAGIMNCPTGTVNSLIFRGLERLRAAYGDDDVAARSRA